MQKIKLLYRLLVFINISSTIMIVMQIALLVIPDLYHLNNQNDHVLGVFNNLALTSLLSLIVFGSFIVQQGIKYVIKKGFFNDISEAKFKRAGFIFILFALCRVIYIIIINKEFTLSELINNFILGFLVLLVGLGLLIFSDFIKNGGILKQENDLTI